MNLVTVKKRLEAQQSLCYQSPAEFISDIRLVFGNCRFLCEVLLIYVIFFYMFQFLTPHNKVLLLLLAQQADRKLKEQFEEHLKATFPDQTFPEIKLEKMPTASPKSQASSNDIISQPKFQRTSSNSEDTPRFPSGKEEVVWKHTFSQLFIHLTTHTLLLKHFLQKSWSLISFIVLWRTKNVILVSRSIFCSRFKRLKLEQTIRVVKLKVTLKTSVY